MPYVNPMAFRMLLSYLIIIHDVSTLNWNLDSIQACRTQATNNGLGGVSPESKYHVWRNGNLFWGIPKSQFGTLQNANLDRYTNICAGKNLQIASSHSMQDWEQLQYLMNQWVDSSEYRNYENDGRRYPDEWFKTCRGRIITGLHYEPEPGGDNRMGTIAINSRSTPTYVVYGTYSPNPWSPNKPEWNYIFLQLCDAEITPTVRKTYLVASTGMEQTPITDLAGSVLPMYRAAAPVICMYPVGSNCYQLSLEEQRKQKQQDVESKVVELTTAFRGTWYLSYHQVLWNRGVEICRKAGAHMFGSTADTKSFYHLPWTKGRSFRWDFNRLYDAIQGAFANSLGGVFPLAAFHATRDNELFFAYNTTYRDKNNVQTYNNFVIDTDPQPITVATFEGWLKNNMEKRQHKDHYQYERFALCYKPYECIDPEIRRKRRDTKGRRRFGGRCSKRRWMKKIMRMNKKTKV